MGIIKGVLIILLAGWVIMATIATLPMELAMKTTERVEFLCVKSGKILNGFTCGH